jgi:hypothetical protein
VITSSNSGNASLEEKAEERRQGRESLRMGSDVETLKSTIVLSWLGLVKLS